MWIVTFHAISLDGYLVDADRLLGNDVAMTIQADRARRRSQKLPVSRRVRIVAAGTFGRLDRGVHEFALELFLEIVMAVQAQLSFRPRLQSEFILPMGP